MFDIVNILSNKFKKMKTSPWLALLAAALSACAPPPYNRPGAPSELAALAKTMETAKDGRQAVPRASANPAEDLRQAYSADYTGSPREIAQNLADAIGWHFEERGAPDNAVIVHIKSASQPALTVLQAIGDQFPYVLVVDAKSRTIALDYTRMIIGSPAAAKTPEKPPAQKYAMDGGIFTKRALAARVAAAYKTKGFDSQIQDVGRKFQVRIGPFLDDGAGERKVRDALGPLRRLP
ncbi:DotD/TraH family lipoprotein [Pseudogulbenkiania ferrooxidans]|nr:DotD/TraH family lipoprotein [Pseudogulbenkiania ferrooxidans]